MNFQEWLKKEVSDGTYISDQERAWAYAAWKVAQPQWQPIKTAPRDGRFLLLGWFNDYGKWQSVNGKWFSSEQILDEWDFSDYEEDDDEDLAKRLEGWYEVAIECNDENSCWRIKPTHFMFKPLPPEN